MNLKLIGLISLIATPLFAVVDEGSKSPSADSKSQAADGDTERLISMTVQVPNGGWSVEIEQVWLLPKQIVVVAELDSHDKAAAILSQPMPRDVAVKDSVLVHVSQSLPTKYYLIDNVKSKGWTPESPDSKVTIIKSQKEIKEKLKGGLLVYDKKASD